ncbi:MAG: DUF2461 domain-containing protein [Salinibacterium sp.]|nr:DUF2461 domain-containing protein [Salinibacterium sp.]
MIQGFSAAAVEFLRGLAAHNTREYWLDHKVEFEALVQAPLESVLGALPEPYVGFRTFRMNRDVRFSSDKSPYKTAHSSLQHDRGAVRYIHFDADGLYVATGAYQFAPDQLERFRRAVDAPASGIALQEVISGLTASELEVTHGGPEPLKTAPRGYDKDHPRIELLRFKGVTALARFAPALITDGDRVLAQVLGVFESSQPLVAWLQDNVGETTFGDRRRWPEGATAGEAGRFTALAWRAVSPLT